jgi:RNA polymerase sigma factor (sigma-70 family)
MRTTDTSEAALVVAAQRGDRRAVEELVTTYLPLVYNVVGRALSGDTDVDDVVQDTMLRALRDLPDLRAPESFRSWLLTIAVRQAGTHRQRRHIVAERTTELDGATGVPDAADFEALTILRLRLSGQRRQVVQASSWLDPEDKALLSLWWLEAAGQLTRTELATAAGLSPAHAAVRVQRMRQQLDLSRSIVAALEAVPRCAGLDAVVADWDGGPEPLWRKRIARHTRSCPDCARAADGLVSAERLLIGLVLVPVPVALVAALVGKAGIVGQLTTVAGAHPVLAALVTVGLVVGTVAGATVPSPQPLARAAAASGPQVPQVRGPVSLESANNAGHFVVLTGDAAGVLLPVGAHSAGQVRQDATFDIVQGLAGAGCVSFRARDGRYLRHTNWRLRLSGDEGTVLFRGDATYCAHAGAVPGSVSWESYNYPGWFVRYAGTAMWVDRSDGSDAFGADSAFLIRPPLAG